MAVLVGVYLCAVNVSRSPPKHLDADVPAFDFLSEFCEPEPDFLCGFFEAVFLSGLIHLMFS